MLHEALSQNMPVVVTSNTIVALELYPIPWAAPCAAATILSTLLGVCPPGSTKLSPQATTANPSILSHAAASVPHDTHGATPNSCRLLSKTRSTDSSAHSFPSTNWSSKVRPLVQSLPASCPWTISNHHHHTSPAKSAAGNSQHRGCQLTTLPPTHLKIIKLLFLGGCTHLSIELLWR